MGKGRRKVRGKEGPSDNFSHRLGPRLPLEPPLVSVCMMCWKLEDVTAQIYNKLSDSDLLPWVSDTWMNPGLEYLL